MDHLEHLRRMFSHDAWANRETLAALQRASAPPAFAIAVMEHILATERLWFARLTRSGERVVVWPAEGLGACDAEATARLWERHLSAQPAPDLHEAVSYVNSRGERWTNTAGDILQHVILHSTYHRGQVAASLRAAGQEPVDTDFIAAVRSGLVG
jgi:uncharacterized damage-inducible protein DinB